MKRFLGLLVTAIAVVFVFVRTYRNSPQPSVTEPLQGKATQGIKPAVTKQFITAAPAIPASSANTVNGTAGAIAIRAPERRRRWDPEYLSTLEEARTGDSIRFELVAGEWAEGTIQRLEHRDGQTVRVDGILTSPDRGRFFFQKQSMTGKAGDFVGVVELTQSRKAYRIEPSGQGRGSELVERRLETVVCLKLPEAPVEAAGNGVAEAIPLDPSGYPTVPIPSYQKGIIPLESLPGAKAVVYLDYQGGRTETWGGITYAKPQASNAEIRDVWKRVAEDYMPFNINVTTDLKVFQNATEGRRQRVAVTPTTTAAPGAGGVAFVGSFNYTGDTPCWSFYATGKNAAEAIAHEVGHTLGLNHDGADLGGIHTEYYGGQGSGATGWAPIMGVGYGQNVTQWSKGEYANANNLQDDLAIITTQNNEVDYRGDDTGDDLTTARYLDIFANRTAKAEGLIERTGDTDAFRFTTTGGTTTLRADPVGDWSDLAMNAGIYDESGNLLASNTSQTVLAASVSKSLAAGTYTFRVTGAGRRDPAVDGFSDYASLGYYKISGTVAGGVVATRFNIAENSPLGTQVGIVTADNPFGVPTIFTITSGNIDGAFTIDSQGLLSVANPVPLQYLDTQASTNFPSQFELFVTIANATDGTILEADRRVVISVTDINEAPTLTGFNVSVFEHSQPGMVIGQVTGADPDFHNLLLYSIAAGNSNGGFTIDNQSGELRVVGDLDATVKNTYTLSVVVSDQAAPTPLMATSIVNVAVLNNDTPFTPGSINYAVYQNIPGTAIVNLTSSQRYPYDPDQEKYVTLLEGDADRGDDYGAVMRGYLIPPATGNYTFWIASDDAGDLSISSNTNTTPLTRIAYVTGAVGRRSWTNSATQKSTARSLVAGKPYYLEAKVKEGGGNDHIAVAWECKTAGITQDVVPGRYLAPIALNYTPRAVGFTNSLHRNAIQGSRVGTILGTDVNKQDTLTYSLLTTTAGSILSLNPTNGVVRVEDESGLQAALATSFSMQVKVTDNGVPSRSRTVNAVIKLVAPEAITATTLRQEVWTNIGSGTAVSALTTQSKYPKRPDLLRELTSLDTGKDFADNYGSRIRGILTPKVTGTYSLFISSDDDSSLKTGTTNNPAAATQIASVSGYSDYLEWDKFASQKSTARTLVAGTPVYLEVLHKEGGGGDHVEVAWTGGGNTKTNVITGLYLKPVDINYAPEMIGKTVNLLYTATNGYTVATMAAKDSPVDPLTYKITDGNPNGAFAIDPEKGIVRLADRSAVATQFPPVFNLNVLVQDSGYGDLYPRKSTNVTLKVQVIEGSTYVWSGNGNENWSDGISWAGDAPPDGAALTFTGVLHTTNTNDFLSSAGLVTLANSGFNLNGNPISLRAGVLSQGDNTWNLDARLINSQTISNASGKLTWGGAIDTAGNLLVLGVNEEAAVTGAISQGGGLTKTGLGKLTLEAQNSFTGPTTISSGTLAVTHPRGLSGTDDIRVGSGAILDVLRGGGVFEVVSGQTLEGNGFVSGDVKVMGMVSPGASLGFMSFANNLELGGTMLIELDKNGSAGTNDQVVVAGRLKLGGQLIVTNLGPALVAGDTFRVFNAGVAEGAFGSLTLPVLADGLSWGTSELASTGLLRVGTGNTLTIQPPILNGSKLELNIQSTPGTEYVLEHTSQMVPPVVWTPVSTNTASGNSLLIPIQLDAGQAQQFYRLRSR